MAIAAPLTDEEIIDSVRKNKEEQNAEADPESTPSTQEHSEALNAATFLEKLFLFNLDDPT